MAFTVTDLMDFKRLVMEHPEWRTELRQLVLTEELLTLPAMTHEFAEAQKRTEQRLEEMALAQVRTEQRLEELARAQTRTEQRLEELALAQANTEKAIHVLADRQGAMLGTLLELKFGQRAAGYFGRILRRIRVVLPNALDPVTEDRLEAHLTHEELVDVLLLDVLAVGRLRQAPSSEQAEVWLAVEVAAVIDQDDVERAQRRAALLRKVGYQTIPVVAGEGVTPEATDALQDAPVVLVLNGRSEGWERALAAGT